MSRKKDSIAKHRDPIYIGTSGWSYRSWRGTFYDASESPSDYLEFYARHFATVEVNNTFYRLPEIKTIKSWRDTVPADFIFAIKASQFITHMKRLRDPEQPLRQLFDRIEPLGDRLGPILFQCPPRWHKNVDRLETFLRQLSRDHRYAFEFRDPTWFDREVYDLLSQHDVALCVYDMGGKRSPMETTADIVYVRFHRPAGEDTWAYDRDALTELANDIGSWVDAGLSVYCYFNNDPGGAAPRNAQELLELLGL
jgi:uncharacterized protein YecE (DUF72 family)